MATRRTTVAAALSVCAAAVALPACGSSGSSKPDYCGKRDALTSDIQSLKDINLGAGAVQELKSKLQKIQSDASALASSAKDSFPNESSAVSTSIDNLTTSLDNVSSSPSATDLAAVGSSASQVVTSVSAFANATKDNC